MAGEIREAGGVVSGIVVSDNPPSVFHGCSESVTPSDHIERDICHAESVTVERLLIHPNPDAAASPERLFRRDAEFRGDLKNLRFIGCDVLQLDPITTHFRPSSAWDGLIPATRQIIVASCALSADHLERSSRMTSERDLPLAEQYPSSIARSDLGTSKRSSAVSVISGCFGF